MTKKTEQATYEDLAAKFEQALQGYETAMLELEARQQQEREATAAEWSAKVEAAQAARDKFALEIKLKEYPKALIEEHSTCSVCGAVMRPFKIAEGEKVVKLWACSAGNRSETHDLIRVE
jgi:transposase